MMARPSISSPRPTGCRAIWTAASEVAFPILDPHIQAQLFEILSIQLADTVKARTILPDGRSKRVEPDPLAPVRSQQRLYEFTKTQSDAQMPVEGEPDLDGLQPFEG